MATSNVSNDHPCLLNPGSYSAGGASTNAAPSLNYCSLLDLPSEVFLRLVSLSDFSTRMSLALTCKRLLCAVETHEKKVYESIKRDHRVDKTFEKRVCDQSEMQTTITRRKKPVSVPYRYRKTIAMIEPLYSITSEANKTDVTGGDYSPYETILSPSEDRIAIIDQGDTAYTNPRDGQFPEPLPEALDPATM